MGRHFEVRAAAMAGTAAKKSALFQRASKEIYLAAKQGGDNPVSNLALKGAIDKYKGQGVSKDVIDRAIKKAHGTESTAYITGRYEIKGPGTSLIVVDTLTDNVNRAIADLKAAVKKTHTTFATVNYNFTEAGIFGFTVDNQDLLEETLVLNDIDVIEMNVEDGKAELLVTSSFFAATRSVLTDMGVNEFDISEIRMIPNEKVDLQGEDKELFDRLMDMLEEIEDVQEVYHNVNI